MRRETSEPKLGASRSRARQWIACGLALVAAAALAACGDSDSSSSSSDVTPRSVTARLFFAPSTLDPDAANELGSIALAAFAYDTPVAIRDGEIVPQLASKWEVTPTSAKLWIKPDVKCSDGSDLTAKEVADSINRLKDPKTKAARVAAWFGSATDFNATADAAENTVDVTLKKPYGDLLFGLTQSFIVCRAALDDPKLLLKQTYGSGPYALTSAVSGDHYTYKVNKGYAWGPDGATNAGNDVPTGIEFKVIENETTATNQFITGQLDLTMAQGPDVARLNKAPRVTSTSAVTADTYGVRINHASPRATSNVDVRRLLFAGTDRQSFASALFGKDAKVPETVVLPRGICYQPDAVSDAMLPYDAAAAAEYATTAGYELQGGKLMKDGKQLTLKVLVPDVVGQPAADFLTSAWGKLGIKVEAQMLPVAQAVQRAFTPGGDWDVFVEGTGGGDSPTTLLRSYTGPPPPKGSQYAAVQNADFDRITGEAKTQITTEVCDQWGEAERALYEQADVIPFAAAQASWYGHNVTFKPWLLSAVYPETLRLK